MSHVTSASAFSVFVTSSQTKHWKMTREAEGRKTKVMRIAAKMPVSFLYFFFSGCFVKQDELKEAAMMMATRPMGAKTATVSLNLKEIFW